MLASLVVNSDISRIEATGLLHDPYPNYGTITQITLPDGLRVQLTRPQDTQDLGGICNAKVYREIVFFADEPRLVLEYVPGHCTLDAAIRVAHRTRLQMVFPRAKRRDMRRIMAI